MFVSNPSFTYFGSSSLTDLFRIDEFKLHVSPSPNDQVPVCRVVQKREQELPELQGAAALVWQTVLLPLTCWRAQHKWLQCAISPSPILQNKHSTPYPPVFLAQRKRHHRPNKDPCQDESLWRFHWKRLEKFGSHQWGSVDKKDSPLLLLFWYSTGDFPNDDDWQVRTSRRHRQPTMNNSFIQYRTFENSDESTFFLFSLHYPRLLSGI